jgi:predicted Zn finger-like uncharacterized protein
MNVTCPNCATVYRVDPAKVPETGVRARCNICSAVFAVRREGDGPERPASAPMSAPMAAATAPPAAPAPPPAAPYSAPRAEPPRPAAPTQPTPAAAQASPPASPPPMAAPRPAAYPSPAVPPMAAPRPAGPAAPFAPAAPAAPAGPAFSRPVAPAPPPVSAPPPAPAAAAAPRPAATPGARPVNPFLSQDPALKARRLARALISDMVVYHPSKRQDGLRDGNLRELFEDEIKKSWEEYADQVGKDVADSTPYFKEALNEILAGGRQIF